MSYLYLNTFISPSCSLWTIVCVFFRFDQSAPVQDPNLLMSGMVIYVFFGGLHFSVFMYNYDVLIVSLAPLLPDLKVSRGSTGSSGERQS